jgi:hypothetical protein
MTATANRVGRVALVLPADMADDWPGIAAALAEMLGAGYQLTGTLSQWIRTNHDASPVPVLHVESDITTAEP